MAPYISTVKPGYFGKGSVQVAPPSSPDEGGTRRLAITCETLITQPTDGVVTVYDVLQYSARVHGSHRALGWRDVIRVHEEKKEVKKVFGDKEVVEMKTWKYFQLSDYKYISFIEFEEMVAHVARALVDLGFTTDHIFNIYAQTSMHWQLMAHACSSISTTIATAYDTLGEAGLTHSLNEPECIGIFTNADLIKTVLNVLPNTPTVKFVFFDGEPPAVLVSALNNVRSDIHVISVSTLLERGRNLPPVHLSLESRRPTKDTLACIMYTSGSTGAPKGVCITHGNLIASVGSVVHVFGHHLPVRGRYLAYLPLAHVLEYIVELCALYTGVTSGYARPKTLMDASVRGCQGDLAALRPNFMFGVPAVWETIRKGILGKVAEGGWARQKVFEAALALKKAGVPVLSGVVDSLVLCKIREAIGGRLMFTMNGGAAISKDTQDFLSWVTVPMMQGYGMTESCGMCTLLPPELPVAGPVGLPVPSIEIKLLDVPSAGYSSKDVPPRGEICIRGPSVTKGYYKRPDLNDDENIFTKDGWFRTGDVGQWNEDGTLSVIDRIKNLVKLQSGEYVALERLESVYKSCHLVANLCIHASPAAAQPMAIIVPHEANLRAAIDADSRVLPFADLCANPAMRKTILKECNDVGRRTGFRPFELLAAVVLTPEEWTPENGLVTPAMKLQRAKIGKVFEQEIKKVYMV
ncbi:Long-chain-fatty-acid--CoA ligase 2 [Termitomyces sp. T112]|nr:Long-chain-fatty-acid--CoA ligase 2 [Termitomyces sp. T112]